MTRLRLEIDPLNLHDEWKNHPSQYGDWARKSVQAQDEYDRAKASLDLVKSEVASSIRADPNSFGLDKSSEAGINSVLVKTNEYQEANNRVLNAKKEVGKCSAVLNALEHRKRALSLLVELWIREYYSDIKLTDEEKAEIRKRGSGRKQRRERDTDSD